MTPAQRTVKKSESFSYGRATLTLADCLEWLADRAPLSVQAVVTDPPYGLVEYSPQEQAKLRAGHGGVWRIPPSFDGHKRSPLPRFTTLTAEDLRRLEQFFARWATSLMRVLVPGAHVIVASNPLVSHILARPLAEAGFERRGEIIRLVTTLRGGDRPKNAHQEFSDVTVMPRSMFEPWLLFRKPLEGRVQDNLRKWRTGALRRISRHQPFGDVIASHPTRPAERALAPHPSLKPQSFMLDPFAGAGSTLAAANALGYASIGIEHDPHYFEIARKAIPELSRLTSLGIPIADEASLFPRDGESPCGSPIHREDSSESQLSALAPNRPR
jgi:DNA modification methylase